MSTPNPQDLTAAIKGALLAGDKIGAIKLYRQQTGAGLAEAKEAVENLQAGFRQDGGARVVVPPGTTGSQDQSAAIREALFASQKIQAIKLYREQTKVGLAEAKKAVEKIEAQLRLSAPGLFTAQTGGKGCLVSIGLCGLVGAALWKILA
jgi:ribosomal protein L7/L12